MYIIIGILGALTLVCVYFLFFWYKEERTANTMIFTKDKPNYLPYGKMVFERWDRTYLVREKKQYVTIKDNMGNLVAWYWIK